ncbi:MAG TPA: DUF983 domain-containing protein [Candidatus Xenobia bacterium]|jgi:uncharacterized protein (DUF983 family)
MQSWWKGIVSATLNRCPRCGRGQIFRSPLIINERCSECGVRFQPYEGDWLGAMAICYVITAVATLVGYLAVGRLLQVSDTVQIVGWSLFALAFYLGFYRNMKGLWIGILYLMTGLKENP